MPAHSFYKPCRYQNGLDTWAALDLGTHLSVEVQVSDRNCKQHFECKHYKIKVLYPRNRALRPVSLALRKSKKESLNAFRQHEKRDACPPHGTSLVRIGEVDARPGAGRSPPGSPPGPVEVTAHDHVHAIEAHTPQFVWCGIRSTGATAAPFILLSAHELQELVARRHPINRLQCGKWVTEYAALHRAILAGKAPQRYAIMRSKQEFGNGETCLGGSHSVSEPSIWTSAASYLYLSNKEAQRPGFHNKSNSAVPLL
eukprot:1161600-Pelagomonas_calceolata.AAC.7